jgi:hypothetical protein
MLVVPDDPRREPALEEVPMASVAVVEAHRVPAVELLHAV